MTIRLTSRIAVVAATALLASGCGAIGGVVEGVIPQGNEFTEQGPRAIAEAAFAEMQEQESLRLLGTADTDDGPTRVDVRVGRSGCVGDFEVDGGSFQLVRNKDGAWVKADDNYWRSQAGSPQQGSTLVKRFRSKWIAVERKSDLDKLCDLEELLASFDVDEDDTDESLSKGEIEAIGDRKAIAVTGGEGKDRVTAWVAIDAPHLVLKMAPVRQGAFEEALFFEEFGGEVDAETPKKADIVSLPKG
jgi:hypothetical protein